MAVCGSPEIRSLVNLHQIVGFVFATGQFDIVFCRNVLIYFSIDNKRQIIKIAELAAWGDSHPASESLNGIQMLCDEKSMR